jgi:hypothetical protein
VPVPSQDLDFQCHCPGFFCLKIWGERSLLVFDVSGIVDHHCLNSRLYQDSSPSNKFTGKNNYMIYIHYYRHDELIKERFLFATAKFEFFTFPKKILCPLFFFINIPKENPFRQLDKQLVLCLQCTIVIHIVYNCVLYMILILPRHCLIYDPDFSTSLSYIWSWFFPVTVLYMILIFPLHCLIYDPDSSPSCTVLYMILILPRHALSYIWF